VKEGRWEKRRKTAREERASSRGRVIKLERFFWVGGEEEDGRRGSLEVGYSMWADFSGKLGLGEGEDMMGEGRELVELWGKRARVKRGELRTTPARRRKREAREGATHLERCPKREKMGCIRL